jgi:hypothetical protein
VPPGGRAPVDEIHPPAIRIAEEVREGHVHRGEIVHAQVKIRHPNRTGLDLRDGRFVPTAPPFHLRELRVLYGREEVSRFALTSALSDDPFFTFALRLDREEVLRVQVANNRGQRFEATHPIRFG